MLATFLVAVTATTYVSGEELGQTFPTDVKKFISDREACDHFRGEPRDFDVSYKEKVGKKAEIEEAERAAFLEEMAEKTCYQMNKRLTSLNRKYRTNKIVIDKLAQYEYLDIGEVYVEIHKNFPDAKLLQQKLIAKGFSQNYVTLVEDQTLPARFIIQIGSAVEVDAAQWAIEALLEYGPKGIGVVVLPKNSLSFFMFRILIGNNPVGNYQVYTGDSIQKLLAPDLTQQDFEKFAKLIEPEPSGIECSKELTACRKLQGNCISMTVDPSTCNRDCQMKVIEKLYSVGVSAALRTYPMDHYSCVGYRRDISGTEEGAKCIAKLLGYEYDPHGCNTDGRPYNVWVH
jgi:hypothetical protein